MKVNNILPMMFRVFILLCLLIGSVSAIPHLINFEGKLSDPGGNPLTGDYVMVFKIYDNQTEGTLLWNETYDGSNEIHVENGIFNVLLGSQTALNLTFDTDYYLGITVESDPEMTPRQPLASVGYAYRAEYCEMGDIDWTISGNDMSSGVSGNVGIGTTNPSAKLDVSGNTNIEGWFNVYKANDRNRSLHIFWDPWVAYDWVRMSPIIHTAGAPLTPKFTIHGNPLEIKSEDIILNGSVGIGTIDPQGYKFAVNGGDGVIAGGKLRVQTVCLGGAGGYYAEINGNEIRGGGVAGPGNNPIHIKPGDTQSAILLAEDGGSVGIGTTNPSAKLDVSGNTNIEGWLNVYKANDRNRSLSIFWDPWVAYDWVRLSPIIHTAGAPLTPKFTIHGNPLEIKSEDIILNGSVGIGTTDPVQELDISGVMRLEPTNTPGTCDTGKKGSIYYDKTLNEPCFCDGYNWKQFDGGGTC